MSENRCGHGVILSRMSEIKGITDFFWEKISHSHTNKDILLIIVPSGRAGVNFFTDCYRFSDGCSWQPKFVIFSSIFSIETMTKVDIRTPNVVVEALMIQNTV